MRDGSGYRSEVMVEHVAVDVVDVVARGVVAAVIAFARLSAPVRRLFDGLPLPSPFSAPPTGMPALMNGDSRRRRTR